MKYDIKSFINEIYDDNTNISKRYMEYQDVKNKYSFIIFVEGITDKYFYNGVLAKKLKTTKDAIYFICGHLDRDKSDDLVISQEKKITGKKAVLMICEKICNEKNEMKFIDKCKFIVDRDYDEIDHVPDEKFKLHINMLPCYSFENYYLYNNNLEIIFRNYFNASYKSWLDDFDYILNVFIREIIDYCVWKKLAVRLSLHDEKESVYCCVHNDKSEKLFSNIKIDCNARNIQIHQEFYLFVEKAKTEIISNSKNDKRKLLELQFKNYANELQENPRKLIKGKLLFDFLIKFINQVGEKSVSRIDLYKLSKDLIETSGIID